MLHSTSKLGYRFSEHHRKALRLEATALGTHRLYLQVIGLPYLSGIS